MRLRSCAAGPSFILSNIRVINYSEKAGGLLFQVYVVPRASRSEIAGEHAGALRVRIAAAPVDGAANRELIALLAKALGVPRSAIEIKSGETGKLKRIFVKNCAVNTLVSLINDVAKPR